VQSCIVVGHFFSLFRDGVGYCYALPPRPAIENRRWSFFLGATFLARHKPVGHACSWFSGQGWRQLAFSINRGWRFRLLADRDSPPLFSEVLAPARRRPADHACKDRN